MSAIRCRFLPLGQCGPRQISESKNRERERERQRGLFVWVWSSCSRIQATKYFTLGRGCIRPTGSRCAARSGSSWSSCVQPVSNSPGGGGVTDAAECLQSLVGVRTGQCRRWCGRTERLKVQTDRFHTFISFSFSEFLGLSVASVLSMNTAHRSQWPILHIRISFFSDSETLAARVLLRTKKVDLITPVHRALNWLPVSQRTDFKILLLAYKAQNGFGSKRQFLICCRVLNRPDLWGHQVQVCCQPLESELHMEEQRSVIMSHISGTNSLKTAGLYRPSLLFNQDRGPLCLTPLFTGAILRLWTELWFLFF